MKRLNRQDDTGEKAVEDALSNALGNVSLERNEQTLDDQLTGLKVPVILPGKQIYPLWTKLLERWLSNSALEVYLASPFIDIKRLKNICEIAIKNPTANIKAFYVRDDDNPNDIAKQVEKNLKGYEGVINEKVFKKLRIANTEKKQYFHAKFIGCTDGTDAWVLLTSANFKYSHFDYDNPDWVVYNKMTKAEFDERVIDPIELVYKTPKSKQ